MFKNSDHYTPLQIGQRFEMAGHQLQGDQIVGIAAKIDVYTMENIALAKFRLDAANTANIKAENVGNVQKQSQEMIRIWKNRLGTDVNQVQVRNGPLNISPAQPKRGAGGHQPNIWSIFPPKTA